MIQGLIWILIFTGSYLLIYFSADFFIDNLKELSIKYNFSQFILGLLILGIDPEESIASIIAAINGLPYIALGNVIGNSVLSLTLCFSLPAFFYKIDLKSVSNRYYLILYACLLSILLGIIFSSFIIIFGLISTTIYLVYIKRSIRAISRGDRENVLEELDITKEIAKQEEGYVREKPPIQLTLFTLLSLFFIFLGGEFLIISAEQLMIITGISESIFGFIIISFITNVEELTLVFKSIKKKSLEIGLGGMVGKIIWNLSFTFGISAMIIIQFTSNLILLYNWILLAALISFYRFLSNRKYMYRITALILMLFLIIFLLLNLMTI
ncbi:MAG: hypothetical protein EU533_02565 [Promethearchaeota archaeon]|nr:MAG: hypothetical protein EU533_02565 [Candidatus Lokiarchaeota archaeon]